MLQIGPLGLMGREYDVERLCSSFGVDFRCSGNRARPQASQSVDSGDWAVQRIHECIVGCPRRFCPDRNLGLHAIKLMAGQRREGSARRLSASRATRE
jgi:hypothetical protein